MANEQVEKTIFGYEIDEESIREVVSETERAEGSVVDFTARLEALSAVGSDTARAMKVNAEAFDGNARSTDLLSSSVEKLRAEVLAWERAQEGMNDELDEEAAKVTKNTSLLDNYRKAKQRSQSTGSSPGGRLESIDRVGSVGSQLFSGLGMGEAANTAGLVGDVAGAFTSLNPVLLGVTGAAALVGAGLTALTAEQERIKEATKHRLDIERELYLFIENSTRQQLDDRRQQLLQEIEGEEAVRARRQAGLDAMLDGMNDWQRGVVTLGHADWVSGEFNAFWQKVQESEGVLSDLYTQLDIINEAWEENATAARDVEEAARLAAEAQRELARQQADDQAEDIERDMAFRQQAAQLRDTGTMDQLRSLQQRNHQEYLLNQERIRQLTPLADSSEAVADTIENLRERQTELTNQNNLLLEAVEPVIRAREAEAAAAERLSGVNDNLLDAQTKLVEAQAALIEAQNEYTEALGKHQTELAKIESEAASNRTNALAKQEADRVEAEAQAAADREDALEEHLKALEDINRSYERDAGNAVANRDARALDQAKANFADRKRTEDDSYRERMEKLDETLEKQLDAIEERYEEELARINDAAKKALEVENRRWRDEAIVRNNAIQRALADQQQAEHIIAWIRQGFQVDREMKEIQHGNNLIANAGFYLGVLEQQFIGAMQRITTPPITGSAMGSGQLPVGLPAPASTSYTTTTQNSQISIPVTIGSNASGTDVLDAMRDVLRQVGFQL